MKKLRTLFFFMAFAYATIFGFDYVILAFLVFSLMISIAKNFDKKRTKKLLESPHLRKSCDIDDPECEACGS